MGKRPAIALGISQPRKLRVRGFQTPEATSIRPSEARISRQ